ncbi:hypothetical protein TTRE_0000132401 [Trichuris trichiura]|uniref:LTD domain-containing protein n=1 Tax=Trichuris trichiura TaxID=36087 RepID=A0A077YYZ2_TRITR|nr:hypothetical protein TTRE_0000132401 [Trichuris trichiura]
MEFVRNFRAARLSLKCPSADRLVLKSDKTVTVWSCNSEVTPNPPTDLVTRNQQWPVGPRIRTTLFNASEEELAWRESENVSRSERTSYRSSDPLDYGRTPITYNGCPRRAAVFFKVTLSNVDVYQETLYTPIVSIPFSNLKSLKNIDYLNENADVNKNIDEDVDDDNDVEPAVTIHIVLTCLFGIYLILTSVAIMAATLWYDWFVSHCPFDRIRKICMGKKETEMESPFYKFVENSVRLSAFQQRAKLNKQEKPTKPGILQDSVSLPSEDTDKTNASTETGDISSKSTSMKVEHVHSFTARLMATDSIEEHEGNDSETDEEELDDELRNHII